MLVTADGLTLSCFAMSLWIVFLCDVKYDAEMGSMRVNVVVCETVTSAFFLMGVGVGVGVGGREGSGNPSCTFGVGHSAQHFAAVVVSHPFFFTAAAQSTLGLFSHLVSALLRTHVPGHLGFLSGLKSVFTTGVGVGVGGLCAVGLGWLSHDLQHLLAVAAL